MIPAIRRQTMLDLLKEHELLFLSDIVEAMGSSESTVRRDLKALAHAGEVELLRGGGVRLPRKDGWAWLSPDDAGARLNIIAESSDMETARELCDFYSGEIQRLLDKRD